MAFNQIGLQNEGFFFGPGNDGLKITDFIDQNTGFHIRINRIFKIGRQTFSQIARFADIDNPTFRIFQQLHTGFTGCTGEYYR